MNQRGIHVERRRLRRETHIRVEDWPRRRKNEGVSSTGSKGRELISYEWLKWQTGVPVGHAWLHVERKDSLLVTSIELSGDLIEGDRHRTLVRLLACAGEIAIELDLIGVGDGCLEWEVPSEQVGERIKQVPDFAPVDPTTRRAKALRGRRLLRRC